MDFKIKEIETRQLRPNCGEIDGLPKNPRKISKKNLEKLKKSLKDAPEMLRLREYGMRVPEKRKNDTTAEENDFNSDSVKETVCKNGDIYQLGDHRLMCGDSTDAGDVALLMNGEKVDMVFTDPPYNANYKSRGCDDVLKKA